MVFRFRVGTETGTQVVCRFDTGDLDWYSGGMSTRYRDWDSGGTLTRNGHWDWDSCVTPTRYGDWDSCTTPTRCWDWDRDAHGVSRERLTGKVNSVIWNFIHKTTS